MLKVQIPELNRNHYSGRMKFIHWGLGSSRNHGKEPVTRVKGTM